MVASTQGQRSVKCFTEYTVKYCQYCRLSKAKLTKHTILL